MLGIALGIVGASIIGYAVHWQIEPYLWALIGTIVLLLSVKFGKTN
jgi:ABC-type phosphate/phosphonate transport system permease subunit